MRNTWSNAYGKLHQVHFHLEDGDHLNDKMGNRDGEHMIQGSGSR